MRMIALMTLAVGCGNTATAMPPHGNVRAEWQFEQRCQREGGHVVVTESPPGDMSSRSLRCVSDLDQARPQGTPAEEP
jgi:hypothetical protein